MLIDLIGLLFLRTSGRGGHSRKDVLEDRPPAAPQIEREGERNKIT